MFYQTDFGELRDCQAHALLSCRDYSRLCADVVFKKYPQGARNALTRALAAFVLSNDKMVDFVTNWNDRNFERGTGSPRVRGTPYFRDVEQFADYLDGMIELNGWTRADLACLRVG